MPTIIVEPEELEIRIENLFKQFEAVQFFLLWQMVICSNLQKTIVWETSVVPIVTHVTPSTP